MDPLPIYKELVLMFSFWQVQDCYKVIVALKNEKKTCETYDFHFVSKDTAAFHRGRRDCVVFFTILTSYLEVSLCSNY